MYINAFGMFFRTLTALLFVCSLAVVISVTETLRDLPERSDALQRLTPKQDETST